MHTSNFYHIYNCSIVSQEGLNKVKLPATNFFVVLRRHEVIVYGILDTPPILSHSFTCHFLEISNNKLKNSNKML